MRIRKNRTYPRLVGGEASWKASRRRRKRQNFEESYGADYLKKNGEGEDAGKEHSRQKKTMFIAGNGKWNAVFEELHNFPVAWHFPLESVI